MAQRLVHPEFLKPWQPSEALAKIVGSEPISRVAVVQKVWSYIKENKLQDKKERRNINCNRDLQKVCGKKVVSMFELAKLLTANLSIPAKMTKGLRFKVGDKVTIIDNLSDHHFAIGETVEICKLITTDTSKPHYNARNARASWFIAEEDCKLATTKASVRTPKIKSITMANGTPDSTRRALVLGCAQSLLKANNTVTTLEIKTELRKSQPAFYWTQDVVSEIMDDFATSSVFTYTDNGTFRTYSDPSRVVTKTTTRSRSHKTVTKKTRKATKKAKSTSTKTWTPTATISRTKALNLMMNNKGHYFTVVFTKKEDGSERTMNCQYLPNQTLGLGYVKVREASKLRTGAANSIRQFALDSMKILSIAKNTYKIRK